MPTSPLGDGMVKAVERADEIGATALQVFSDNPTAWQRRAEPPKEQPAFRERSRELDIGPLAIHASYLINLAGADETSSSDRSRLLASELEARPRFGARFVNVHAGSHRGAGHGSRGVGVRSPKASAGPVPRRDGGPDAPLLVLENSAGGGDTMGSTLEELAEIADGDRGAARRPGARRVLPRRRAPLGRRLPNLRARRGRRARRARSTALIGLDRLALVHLNDTRSGLGSRIDRHEHVGAGQIGPRRAAAHCSSGTRGSPASTYILETPGMDEGYDAINVGRALEPRPGEPLAPLPPEAFDAAARRQPRRARPTPPDERRRRAGRPAGRRTTAEPAPRDRSPSPGPAATRA